jgi:cold-inducible RNA-binding protein
MGKKLYVGNISFKATEDSLRELFTSIGEVGSLNIVTDSYTGQSKGFGFVEMTSDENAQKAIASLNGKSFMERNLTVAEARPKPSGDRGGFDRGRSQNRGRR